MLLNSQRVIFLLLFGFFLWKDIVSEIRDFMSDASQQKESGANYRK